MAKRDGIKFRQIEARILQRVVSLALILVAGVLGLLFLCPVVINSASAEEMRASVSTNATVTIKSTVSVALTSALDIAVLPKSEGAFNTGTANLRIATNNTSGYKAYIHTTSTDGALRALDKSNTRAILPLTGTMTSSNFSEHLNSWGYADTTNVSPESASYAAVPTSDESSALLESSAETSDDSYNLSFGTAIGIDLPAGEYQGSVTVSVVANPVEITNLSQLTYMQDMTPDICQNTMDYVDKTNYATKQLIDTRDGKSYWVAKLADGNCWMTQNLALTFRDFGDSQGMRAEAASGKAGAILTSENTDLATNTTFQTMPATLTETAAFSNTTTSLNSFYLGHFVLATPTAAVSCGSIEGTGHTLLNCTKAGMVYLAGSKWKPTFQAQDGTWDGKDQYVAAQYTDPTQPELGGTYDAHYTAGGYYTFNLATAGSGGTSESGDAPYSICPRGWKLPSHSNASGSFTYLWSAYGVTDKVGGNTSADDNAAGYNLTKLPVAYVRAGTVYPKPSLGYVGDSMLLRANTRASAVDFDSSASYYAGISGANITMSYRSQRAFGGNVRCVAR